MTVKTAQPSNTSYQTSQNSTAPCVNIAEEAKWQSFGGGGIDMRYSDEFREKVLAATFPPNERQAGDVAQQFGVIVWSVYRWRRAAKASTVRDNPRGPSERPLAEKPALLLEGIRLSGEQLGEGLRGRGLDSQHLTLFEQEIREVMTNKERHQRDEIGVLRRGNRRLERDLLRKYKALAELAAVLTLRKTELDIRRGGQETDSRGRSMRYTRRAFLGRRRRRCVATHEQPVIDCAPVREGTGESALLKSLAHGSCFYAYIVLDLWDRSIVGRQIADTETSSVSEELFCALEQCTRLSAT
jgi:transposase